MGFLAHCFTLLGLFLPPKNGLFFGYILVYFPPKNGLFFEQAAAGGVAAAGGAGGLGQLAKTVGVRPQATHKLLVQAQNQPGSAFIGRLVRSYIFSQAPDALAGRSGGEARPDTHLASPRAVSELSRLCVMHGSQMRFGFVAAWNCLSSHKQDLSSLEGRTLALLQRHVEGE